DGIGALGLEQLQTLGPEDVRVSGIERQDVGMPASTSSLLLDPRLSHHACVVPANTEMTPGRPNFASGVRVVSNLFGRNVSDPGSGPASLPPGRPCLAGAGPRFPRAGSPIPGSHGSLHLPLVLALRDGLA